MYPASHADRRVRSALPSLLIETLESRNLLSTTTFGTPGSYQNAGNDYTKAFDNDPATYVDAPVAQAYAGVDYGTPVTVNSVTFYPRPGLGWRMVGGLFQGSNDNATWTNLTPAIQSSPADNVPTTLNTNDLTPFRYVRYLSPNGGYGNVADIQFHLQTATPDPVPALTGFPIGTNGSWNNAGNTLLNAFDGDPATFFDAPTGTAAAGLQLSTPSVITSVSFYPRADLAFRMVDGQFQGSNDNATWTTLATISTQPADGQYTSVAVTNPTPFRYVRYLSPSWGYGNVAELHFYGSIGVAPTTPVAPTNLTGSSGPNSLNFSWTDNATDESRYSVEISTSPDFVASALVHSDFLGPNANFYSYSGLTPGQTYYFRVRAENLTGTSPAVSDYATTGITFSPATPFLTGIPIGTPGSWNNSGNTFDKALDTDGNTFFDAPISQAYVGLQFDAPRTLSSVQIIPRANLASRVTGAQIQSSTDGITWTTPFYTITTQPAPTGTTTYDLSTLDVSAPYVRYLSPEGGFGNLAELQFLGTITP